MVYDFGEQKLPKKIKTKERKLGSSFYYLGTWWIKTTLVFNLDLKDVKKDCEI